MEIIIKQAVEKDLPQIMDIYNNAIINTTATFDTKRKTLDDRKAWFKNHGTKYPIFVAYKDNEIVGWACINQFKNRRAYNKTVEDSIYIKNNYKGMGIGSKLLDTLINVSNELGYHTIISVITAENIPSIKLHEKFGFKKVGVIKEVGYKFNRWIDVMYMQKILDK